MSAEPALVLVTGAGRGAGEAAALALGASGAHVVAIDVNPDSAERTAESIRAAGGQARAVTADVSNKLSAQTLLYGLLEGGARLAALVNAAHVAPAGLALKLDEWEWNRTLDVNLKGVFLMSQTVARAMKETDGGLIVNVQRPQPVAPHAAVWAAEAGLLGLTDALAAEWGQWRVRVRLAPAAEAGPLTVAWLQEPW
ncbi:MAG: SDR family NAD(P)-dependent oxidoreductase [Anaerolineales bacterium]|nr:SDR family NAD(P)-dependent oxidoreductase [Anaerolineales bacterium]